MDLKGTSFQSLKQQAEENRRLIAAIDGLERQGKTHLALTAPGPLAYMQLDPGGDDVVPKARKLFPKKEIVHSKYYVDVKPGLSREDISRIANQIWMRWTQDYELILPALGTGTLVVDTGTEAFTCLKLARFGKLTQVMPEDYAPVHSEFKRLLRMPYNYRCNVIWLHKLKAEYERPAGAENKKGSGKKTGNLVRDGYSGTGYEVQMNARAYRDSGSFMLNVQDCRQNPDLDGLDIPVSADLGFGDLMSMVYPDTEPGDWR